ncbi:MAG: TolC family outer membrane protein [Hyphomicrobiaceae bacterium]|nr:TolC family outer membrane protein [Hyphomicrobiaceae bacterium]
MRVTRTVEYRPLYRRVRSALGASAAILLLCLATPAKSESLNAALALAYTSNPQLQAARAQLRATDETVPQARAARRPTITGQAGAGHEERDLTLKRSLRRNILDPLGRQIDLDSRDDQQTYSVTLSQSLFRGFQTINTIREAEANVLATRESLRNTEQTTLLDAVTAYMDVIQNQATVGLQKNDVEVLTEYLASNERRFKAGALTETDLAQSKAQRAASTASLEGARGQLKSSEATYFEVIGRQPRALRPPASIAHLLPRSLGEAIEIAQREHPAVVSALFQEEAARNAVAAARGKMLPQVDLQLQHSREFDSSAIVEKQGDTSAFVRLTVPFYQGGAPSSQVRQAKQTLFQRQEDVRQARLQVRSGVVSAWSQLASARAQLRSNRIAAEANNVALKGTRREEKAGTRTVLDVLNAQQTALSSNVQLVVGDRNVVVANYTLLSAVGRLSALNLRLAVELYDAEAYYRFVRRKLWGTRVEPPGASVEPDQGRPRR